MFTNLVEGTPRPSRALDLRRPQQQRRRGILGMAVVIPLYVMIDIAFRAQQKAVFISAAVSLLGWSFFYAARLLPRLPRFSALDERERLAVLESYRIAWFILGPCAAINTALWCWWVSEMRSVRPHSVVVVSVALSLLLLLWMVLFLPKLVLAWREPDQPEDAS
jgi:hypothetical protein